MTTLIVRDEIPEDLASVRSVNEKAFGQKDEADLVDRLRQERVVLASLVAEREKQIVGHILFSRMWIETSGPSISAVALAPLAVLPERQRQGIGAELIRYGLNWLHQKGETIVIVLGSPTYYPRFGFSAEKARHLVSPFPPEAFMALELQPGALDGVAGRVKYPEAFGI
jgi:putative acetyltransferase